MNDYKDLISVFYNVNILSEWRIILSLHPATSLKEVNRFLAKLKLKNKIEIFKEIFELDLNVLRKNTITLESKKNTIKQTKKAPKYPRL